MKITDKRKGKWRILVENEKCSFLIFPRTDIACRILEDKPENNKLGSDTYCYCENCPIKGDISK
ncbi:hypothetical protein LCGC14_2017460 [marine sediment metagenome]|uniref:Uncharacterized protein n=1 Tax=marine sediment metagenome TaxID=412755 RepID=A0A0F9EYJ7_9ZZZZ